MWIALAVLSAVLLGIYDVFKKISVTGNNVLTVLFFNTLFGALLLSPVIIRNLYHIASGSGNILLYDHLRVLLKSFIVLSSWVLGYFAVKHLPLTITGPISATRPVLVLAGALFLYREQPNGLQWAGIFIGFISLLLIHRIGKKDGVYLTAGKWIWFAMGAAVMGAVSGLYDKSLMAGGRLTPMFVQSWYSLYQCIIMGITIAILKKTNPEQVKFQWRWSIPAIALFLTFADIAYFYALASEEALISVVSMVRRGSVLVPFCYGVSVLHEKNVKWKLLDLLLLMAGLLFLVWGSK